VSAVCAGVGRDIKDITDAAAAKAKDVKNQNRSRARDVFNNVDIIL
jgi:hypothetical protein